MLRAIVLLVTLAGAVAAAQVVQTPARDRPNGPPPPPVGRGTIKGRVLDAQTGTALARARVRLNWMGAALPRPPVTTDDSGSFQFTALPAGSFMLSADKSTYLSARFPEGGQTMRSGQRALTLADGQTVDNVVIAMYHGGAITGRVLDAHGDPVEYAQVQALRLPKSGRGRPQQRGGTSSNDLGEFRIARLDPARYVLFVLPQRRDMNVPPGQPAPEVAEMQSAPTFYPGVVSIDQAQAVNVERGTTAGGVDIMLIDAIVSQVSGLVVDASGQPVTRGGSVNVRPVLRDLPGGFGATGTGVRPDGTFQMKLPPGEYDLEARAQPIGTAGPQPGLEQLGSARIVVAGDVTGLTIQLGAGARVTGRIVFDGTAPLPAVPTSANGPGPVMFTSSEGAQCRSGRGAIHADWTFAVEGVFGACTPRVNSSNFQRWFVKGIVHEGRDLMDQLVVFAPGQQMRDVEVIMTDKRTELTFHVSDESGTPTREYVGLVFSVDKARWTDATNRYVRTIVPPPDAASGATATASATAGVVGTGANRTTGRETASGMPAGEYFVIAVDDIESEASRDPDVLEQLSRGATRVTLADGVPADVNLRRVKLTR